MKVLIIGLNYAPEVVGIGPYTAGLAETLVQRGHQVEAVVGEPYYPEWRRRADTQRADAAAIERGVRVTRCRHFIPAEPTGLKRIVHLASFALSAFLPSLRAARRMRPDVVFTVAPSLLSVPTAWAAARLVGAKLWTHVQDFEVEAAFATGLLNGRGPLARLAEAVETAFLALSDRVSAISPQMSARLVRKGVPASRVRELRNWANLDFAPDADGAARFRADWDIGPRKVALYSGNIANKQGIEIIIAAARHLADRDDLLFVICGQGSNRRRLRELAAGLPNVQLHDLQPPARMGGLLALAAMHLLPQLPGTADLVLPSKLTNMLISARPVVATADAGTGLADEVAGCGIVTPPGDAAALARAVATLADDPSLAVRLGNAAGHRARERWSQAMIIDRFESDLGALIPAPQAAAALTRHRA